MKKCLRVKKKKRENDMGIRINHNGISISVENWKPWKKLPVLAVRIDGENAVYKVASFVNEETAKWFCEIIEEFADGLFIEEESDQ